MSDEYVIVGDWGPGDKLIVIAARPGSETGTELGDELLRNGAFESGLDEKVGLSQTDWPET